MIASEIFFSNKNSLQKEENFGKSSSYTLSVPVLISSLSIPNFTLTKED